MKLRLFLPVVAIVLFSFPSLLKSQVSQLKFEHLPQDIGWNNNAINDILQDHQGFLWVATWSGLVKYDGYSGKVYRQVLGESKGLKSNKITCLFEDSKGRLWIGTNYTGLYQYDREQDNFIQYAQDPENMNSLSNNNVWAIKEDRLGYLWVGTEKGLNRFNPKDSSFIHYEKSETDELTLSYNFVYSISETSSGDLWIGCEIGLNRLIRKKDGSPDYFIRYSLAPEGVSEDDFLRHNFIKTSFPSQKEPNTLWVGTSIGLKKITYSNDQLEQVDYETFYNDPDTPTGLSHGFISDVMEDATTENVWIATYNGLNQLDLNEQKIIHHFTQKDEPHSLTNNLVRCVFKDRSGVLWIGTEKGLNKVNLKGKGFQGLQFWEGQQKSNNIISCITQAQSRSGLWIGTMGGGLLFLPVEQDQIKTKEVQYYKIKTKIASDLSGFISGLVVDPNGNLLISTQGAGLIQIKESAIPTTSSTLTDFIQFTKEDKLKDDYIMALTQTRDGTIWLGYWDNGIDRYTPLNQEFQHFSYTKGFSLNLQEFPVVHLLETSSGSGDFIWVGTRGGGVAQLKYNPNDQSIELERQYQYQDGKLGGLSNNFINSLYQSNENELWIGTENGLNKLNFQQDSLHYFLEQDGFANGIIQSILGDDQGRLWVSTQKGISCVHQSDGQLTIKNFDVYDGLQDNFFNNDSALKLSNGKLFFGGVNGINWFHPDHIQPDSTAPQVAFTDFRLFNKPVSIGPFDGDRILLDKNISETSSLELTHEDNVVSIEFVGLQFGEPQKILYAHKLEGFDPDWVYTDASQRIAHYTNLPHDTYTFKVKAANGDGVWSKPIELNLKVLPPFWLTGWAFLIYGLLFLALLYGVRAITKMRAEFNHSLQLEKLEREKLEEVDRMKMEFFTNISHELRTPLTLIISPLEQYIRRNDLDTKFSNSLNRMHHNANRLMRMINQLLDIRKNEAGLMQLHVAENDLIPFLREITSSFQDLAKQRGIDFQYTPEGDSLPLWFDRDQLEKVFINLLSNAFKFTPDQGAIKLSITACPDHLAPLSKEKNILHHNCVLVRVSDSGMGIPKEQIPHIFNRFYQADQKKESKRKAGTGIGLALAKSIVESHHGHIWAESEEGEGATFFVVLYQGNAHFSQEERSPVKESLESSSIIDTSILPIGNQALETGPHKENGHANKPAILIVEDNPDIRSYLREEFDIHYKVTEAEDGIDGLEKANQHPPELIIADISMPRMDGLEFCAKIKSNIHTSHIPVILLTARTSVIYQKEGLETGADDYVTKPFHMELLSARVNNLIQSRNQLKEKFAQNFSLSPTNVVLNSLDEELLSQIKLIVEKHMDDSSFSVEQLATSLHMSRMQLYRKLKALTGKSPNKIIRNIRLERAAQLLKSQKYNVADVTYMVGYNDLKSFREQFKKEYGVSPSEY